METPVDPFPVGWFSVGQAAGLRAGGVRPLCQHGRHLVLWRDESGEAHLLDAIKDPPMLARGDGPIAQLRRWSASFSRADRALTAAAHRESGE